MRLLKVSLWAVVALLIALLAAYAWGRWRPPSAEQKAALDVLHKDARPTQGRNAYPLLWLLAFDIPSDQLDAAYAKDRARVESWYRTSQEKPKGEVVAQPHADFPALPLLTRAEQQALCGVHDPDCLGKARAHNDALHALLLKHSQLLAHDQALSRYDYLWNDMPENPAMPVPPFSAAMGLWQTAIALDFVDGRQAQAFDGACTQISTMRRLHAHSNTLVGQLVLAARLRGGVLLFVQTLSETPDNVQLPASCTTAFAPLTADDVDLCSSIRSEFAVFSSAMTLDANTRWYDRWRLSAPLTVRMMAPGYAAACDPVITRKLLADDVVSYTRRPPSFDWFDTLANRSGVTLSRIPVDDFNAFFARQQDMAATLRMGALLMWMRDNHDDGKSLQQQLQARPAWLRFGKDRHVGITPDGHSLTMKLRNNARGEWPTTWPLPSSS